jgi:hypothetical protein
MGDTTSLRLDENWTIEIVGQDHQGGKAICRIIPQLLESDGWRDGEFDGRLVFDLALDVSGFGGRVTDITTLYALAVVIDQLRAFHEMRRERVVFNTQEDSAFFEIYPARRSTLICHAKLKLQLFGQSSAASLPDWTNDYTYAFVEATFTLDQSYLVEPIRQAEIFLAAMRDHELWRPQL